jgi:hypothetical protein
MRWFGDSWGAPVCESAEHTETPVGESCLICGTSIVKGDQGVEIPYVYVGTTDIRTVVEHLDCFLQKLGLSREGTL